MDELLKSLAAHTGISAETARTALGAVVTFLKEHLPADLSARLMKALPESSQLAAAYEANKSGGSLMDAVAGLAAKFFGGSSGELTKLLEMLHKSGLDLKQVESFLPKVLDLVKAHIPADLLDKIIAELPALKSALEKS